MQRTWQYAFICAILWMALSLGFGVAALAQSDTTYSYTNHRLVGMRVSIGAASSPTSWYGLTIFGGQRHLEYHLSAAKANVKRYAFGVHVLGDVQRKWSWCSGWSFSHTAAGSFTYDPDGLTRREYAVSNAQFVHADVGVMRRVRGYQKRDCRSVVLSVGYQYRISRYAINPSDATVARASEIEKMTKDLFVSRWYWCVSFRFGEFWAKTSRVSLP